MSAPAHPIPDRDEDVSRLSTGLALVVAFMVVEVVAGLAAHSLALLSDAAHMLTDAAALALSLLAARLTRRPARGPMTFGLGRAEILSAQANGLTMLLLGGLILYGAIEHLITPPRVHGWVVLIVALAGVALNLGVVRILGGHGHHGHGHGHGHGHADHAHGPPVRSLNLQGSLTHLASDLFGFLATAVAAAVILLGGDARADAVASLLIAAVLILGGWPLLRAALRVMMEAAPAGLDPEAIGRSLAAHPRVAEVHDLHVWEVTSGFPALSAHVVVEAGSDCHEIRHELAALLLDRFGVSHSTLQVEHVPAPLQIEVSHGV